MLRHQDGGVTLDSRQHSHLAKAGARRQAANLALLAARLAM